MSKTFSEEFMERTRLRKKEHRKKLKKIGHSLQKQNKQTQNKCAAMPKTTIEEV